MSLGSTAEGDRDSEMNMLIKLIILLGKGVLWVISSVGHMIGGIAVGIVTSSEKKDKDRET